MAVTFQSVRVVFCATGLRISRRFRISMCKRFKRPIDVAAHYLWMVAQADRDGVLTLAGTAKKAAPPDAFGVFD